MTSGAIGKCFGLVLDCLIVIGTQSEGFNNSITWVDWDYTDCFCQSAGTVPDCCQPNDWW